MGLGGHKMVQEGHRRKEGLLEDPDWMQPRERLRGKPELLIFFISLNLKLVQPFSKWLITLRQGVVKFPNFDNLTFCNLPVIINMFWECASPFYILYLITYIVYSTLTIYECFAGLFIFYFLFLIYLSHNPYPCNRKCFEMGLLFYLIL